MQPAQLNVPDWIHWNVKLPPRTFGFQSPNGKICKPTIRALRWPLRLDTATGYNSVGTNRFGLCDRDFLPTGLRSGALGKSQSQHAFFELSFRFRFVHFRWQCRAILAVGPAGILPAGFNAAFPAPTMRGQVSRLYARHLSALARHLRKRASRLRHIDAVSHTWRGRQSSPDRIRPHQQTSLP